MERGTLLADLCVAAARGETKPVISVYDLRAILGFRTSSEPGRSFVDRLKALQGKDGILAASVAHGFPAADVPEVGTKVFVVSDNAPEKGAALAKKLADEIMTFTPNWARPDFTPEAAVAKALSIDGGPVVIADPWDNPGGGVPGDSTFMIRELMKHPEVPSAVGALWDPVAVQLCHAAEPGGVLRLRFGGKTAGTNDEPLEETVTVRAVTDDLVIPFQDSIVSLGAAASITIGNLDVVLATGRAQTFSPPVFTSLGIDLSQKKIVVVKSANHFYAAFAPIARDVLYVDCDGPYPRDPRKIAYTKIRRPIIPLDSNPWA
jgi:microcystin degradation protein MlrC